MTCDAKLIRYISENWDGSRRGDSRKSEEVHEMIEAMVAELKNDFRAYRRKNSRISDEDVAFFEGLICDVQDKSFWEKLEYMLGFSFDF